MTISAVQLIQVILSRNKSTNEGPQKGRRWWERERDLFYTWKVVSIFSYYLSHMRSLVSQNEWNGSRAAFAHFSVPNLVGRVRLRSRFRQPLLLFISYLHPTQTSSDCLVWPPVWKFQRACKGLMHEMCHNRLKFLQRVRNQKNRNDAKNRWGRQSGRVWNLPKSAWFIDYHTFSYLQRSGCLGIGLTPAECWQKFSCDRSLAWAGAPA